VGHHTRADDLKARSALANITVVRRLVNTGHDMFRGSALRMQLRGCFFYP
jgi:hypothetical protein